MMDSRTSHLLRTVVGIAVLALFSSPSLAGSGAVQLHTFKTHSRLTFRVDGGTESDLKTSAQGFELFLKGIGLADLGAPLGQEKEWMAEQGPFSDSRLDRLDFQEVPGGLKVTGRWSFPTGAQAPANPVMEHFDYRGNGAPGKAGVPQYVLDFWPKGGPTRAQAQEIARRNERQAEIRKAETDAKKRRDLRVAREKQLAEAERLGRFCELPLSEETDVFLAFEPVHEPIDFTRWFPSVTPDSDYRYLEPKTDAPDAQYVRLALKLYREGKHALALKTLDFLEAEHPQSNFLPEMKFLRANAQIRLGYADQAEKILKRLKVDARDHGVSLYASMYLAARAFQEKQYLAALDEFLWLSNYYGSHRLNWVFRLGAAESLYAIKQTSRAAKEYEWVAANAPDRASRSLAALRIGDVYLDRRQYEQALAAYFQAMNHFEAETEKFPSVHINRAEALYWIGQYDRAEAAFTTFLKTHAAYPASWRATYRLAEIAGRRAGAPARAESRKWLLETINRYPYAAGADLARLRLLPCGDHGGFTADAAERYFSSEAAKFDGKGEVVMKSFPDYRALSQVRTLVMMERGDKAIDVAVEGIQSATAPATKRLLGQALEMLMRKTILTLLEQGKPFEALAFYQVRASSLPRVPGVPSTVTPDYLLKLSQAASDLELGTLGRELSRAYEVAVRRQQGESRGLAAEGDALDQGLKASEKAFSQAKALWVSSGASAEEKIRPLLEQVVEESEFSYGREVILGLLDEKAGRTVGALTHAVRAQLLMPRTGDRDRDVPEANRIAFWVASLQGKAGEGRPATRAYRELRKSLRKEPAEPGLAAVLGVPGVPSAEELLLAEGEALATQGRWGAAAEAYAEAVNDGKGGNQALYQYYRALGRSFESTKDANERNRAQEILKRLAGSETDDFWRKLAREALANQQSTEAIPSRRVSPKDAKEGMR